MSSVVVGFYEKYFFTARFFSLAAIVKIFNKLACLLLFFFFFFAGLALAALQETPDCSSESVWMTRTKTYAV